MKKIALSLTAITLTFATIFTSCDDKDIEKLIAVISVALNQQSATLTVGDTLTLVPTVLPADASDPTLNWMSTDTTVATVSSGTITAISAGTTTISAISVDGGKIANCTLTVNAANVPVTGVNLSQTTATLSVDSTLTLIATVLPADATNKAVTWSSSNTAIATVNNGTVTALAAGTATITVTTQDGSKTATCAVTVLTPTNVESVMINGVGWATHNLAAHGEFVNNPQDHGALFQWGRRGDGHEQRTSPSVSGPITVFDTNGQPTGDNIGKFITNSSELPPYDWRNPQDDFLWNSGTESDPIKTINDPCPQGWRMPTDTELTLLRDTPNTLTTLNGVIGRRFGTAPDTIFLPAAGFRSHGDGVVYYVGSSSTYWSSAVNGTDARGLSFYGSNVLMGNGTRVAGFSVRCVSE